MSSPSERDSMPVAAPHGGHGEADSAGAKSPDAASTNRPSHPQEEQPPRAEPSK